ncbi:hypothetical protein C8J57DRAFT_1227709 [Mycena rebaudengoi]|nr:hypothetical protein C8J57DRAFT_1227709 [Mycena rebaudengoi]
MSDEAAVYRPSSGVRAIPHIQHVAPPHYPITPRFSTPLRSTQIEEDGTGPPRSAALAAVKPTPPATATPRAQPAPRRCAQPHPPQRCVSSAKRKRRRRTGGPPARRATAREARWEGSLATSRDGVCRERRAGGEDRGAASWAKKDGAASVPRPIWLCQGI